VSNISFWKPVYQAFIPDKPLVNEELDTFYVKREDSPVDSLVTLLALKDEAAKFLLSGHRGGGKTTELMRLEQQCLNDYTVIWVDTDTALDKFNIGYAEVVVLIGMTIVERLAEVNWRLSGQLEEDLLKSLARVTYQDKSTQGGELSLPKVLKDLGALLKRGFLNETTKITEVRPALSDIINRVNAIIAAAEADKHRLLVIVDGLDRKEYSIALEMFSSTMLTELNCHIVYAVPISLRYSSAFRLPLESFGCLDLDNIPVFACDEQKRPTDNVDPVGQHILSCVIQKRLQSLGKAYQGLFEANALKLLCVKSGGMMRELVRLVQTSCQVALSEQASQITLKIAQEAVQKVRRTYFIQDYQFPELDKVHRTGKLTSQTFDLPRRESVVICDELLHHKLILGYPDSTHGCWFDINPILSDDLEHWQATERECNGDDR
jgi:hypothetical protein